MLEERIAKYERDPDFVAEGLAIAVIENALYTMQRKGISKSELAAAMGVPKSQISRIFNAPPNLTLRSIARLALALGVKPQALLDVDALVPEPASDAKPGDAKPVAAP